MNKLERLGVKKNLDVLSLLLRIESHDDIPNPPCYAQLTTRNTDSLTFVSPQPRLSTRQAPPGVQSYLLSKSTTIIL